MRTSTPDSPFVNGLMNGGENSTTAICACATGSSLSIVCHLHDVARKSIGVGGTTDAIADASELASGSLLYECATDRSDAPVISDGCVVFTTHADSPVSPSLPSFVQAASIAIAGTDFRSGAVVRGPDAHPIANRQPTTDNG